MKKCIKIIGLFLLLISSSLSAQEDLNRYLQMAAENNSELKAKFNEYLAALELALQVKALPDPQVAFGFFIQPIETRLGPQRLKVSASQFFPWFGTLKAKENVAIQTAKAKYELFEETKSKLFNQIKSTYFDLYFNKKASNITLENIDILNIFKKLAIIKVEAGLVSPVDEYRIEMEINDLENQLALLRDKQYVLEIVFNNLLNTKTSEAIEIPETLWTTDFPLNKKAAFDSILQSNHQLLGIEQQEEAFRYKKQLAQLQGKPDFKIGFEYAVIGKGTNNLAGTDAFVFPTIGLSIPLYRNKYKAMLKQIVFLEKAKNNEKINKTNVLESLFEVGWKDYRDGERRIALYYAQLDLSKKSLSLLETDYAIGNKNFEEILRMDRKLLKYNLELEKARADKQAAISFITYLMGK
ncbi:MAG: TolC family protein [Bacteroidales bacterium]|nr:TolC family protein [Bacteroidales bacterium]